MDLSRTRRCAEVKCPPITRVDRDRCSQQINLVLESLILLNDETFGKDAYCTGMFDSIAAKNV